MPDSHNHLKTIALQGRHLIEASAGTGKTTALCLIYLRLLFEKKLLPENILTVTFTQAATMELKERLYQKLQKIKAWVQGQPTTFDNTDYDPSFLGQEAVKKHLQNVLKAFGRASIYTIHGFCKKVLAEQAFEVGSHFTHELIEDEKTILQGIVDDFWRKIVLKKPDDFLKELYARRLSSPDLLLEPIKILLAYPLDKVDFGEDDFSAFWQQAYHFCRQESTARYLKKQELGYHDLLFNVYDALQGKGKDALIASMSQRYRALLIDEFQDTDFLQYQIFAALQGKIATAFFVGDPKQAIYSFRGADVFAYLAAKRDIELSRRPAIVEGLSDHDAVFRLDCNYRSSKALVASINTLFDKPNPFVVEGIDYTPLAAVKDAAMTQNDQPYPALSFLWFENDENPMNKGEAEKIAVSLTAEKIACLLQEGQIETDAKKKRIQASDIAVLVYTHVEAEKMAQALEERHIPSVRAKQTNVFATEEAEHLFIVLWALLKPEWPYIRAALGTPLLGAKLAEIAGTCHEGFLEKESERFHDLRLLWQKKGFAPMFSDLMRGKDKDKDIAARLMAYSDGKRRLANLLQLADLLQEEETYSGKGMDGIVAWLVEQRENALNDHNEHFRLRALNEGERVQILTVYAAKGLEFPIVFCPFAWAKTPFATRRPKPPFVVFHPDAEKTTIKLSANEDNARKEMLSEQVRLFYVAITRARYACHILIGPVRGGKNQGNLDHVGHSAIGWLLDDRKNFDPAPFDGGSFNSDKMKQLCEKINAKGGFARLETHDLKQASQARSLRRLDAPDAQNPTVSQPLAARSFNRSELQPSFGVSSFSSLVHHAPAEAPDYDAQNLQGADALTTEKRRVETDCKNIASFPKGAKTGECWHSIFEAIAKGLTDPKDSGAFHAYITEQLQLYGFSEDWADAVQKMVEDALKANLHDFTLGDVIPFALPEFGFTFKSVLPSDALQELQRILGKEGAPEIFAKAAKKLSFQGMGGFMRGFIDLVFRSGDKYYILDYKSNWLGEGADAYDLDALEKSMAEHHYYLQYLVYTVAIYRYLKTRRRSYACFGGVFYLFLRGMEKGKGIYFDQPSERLILALDEWLLSA